MTLKIDNINKIQIDTNLNVQIVRIIHRGNHIVIELIYNKEYTLKEDNKRYAAIDLGLNNLATLTSNICQSNIYDLLQYPNDTVSNLLNTVVHFLRMRIMQFS